MITTIVGIVGGIIMFVVLYSKRTLIPALVVSLFWVIMLTFGSMQPEDYKDPDKVSPELKRQVTNMGMTMEEFAERRANQTPLERIGEYSIGLLFFTALFVWIVVGDPRECDDDVMPVWKRCIGLLIVVSLYFLSLYWGLKITVFAIIKPVKKKIALSKEKAPAPSLTELSTEKQFQL